MQVMASNHSQVEWCLNCKPFIRQKFPIFGLAVTSVHKGLSSWTNSMMSIVDLSSLSPWNVL